MATVVNIRPSQSSEIIEEAFSTIPGIMGQMRQMQMQNAKLDQMHSAELRQQAEFDYTQELRRKSEDAKKALFTSTSGSKHYRKDLLADENTWGEAFSDSSYITNRNADWDEYVRLSEISGNTPDAETWEKNRSLADMRHLNSKIDRFNVARRTVENQFAGQGITEKQVNKYMQEKYGADELFNQAKIFFGEGELPAGARKINYTPVVDDRSWDEGVGDFLAGADPVKDPQTGETIVAGESGWGLPLGIVGGLGALAIPAVGRKIGLGKIPGVGGWWDDAAGLADEAAALTDDVAKGGAQIVRHPTANIGSGNWTQREQSIWLQLKQIAQKDPEKAQRMFDKLVKSNPGLRDLGGAGPLNQKVQTGLNALGGGSSKQITDQARKWFGLGGQHMPGLWPSIAYGAAPMAGALAGQMIGGDKGELAGETLGTGLSGAVFAKAGIKGIAGTPAAQSFMKYLLSNSPKMMAKAAALSQVDGPLLPIGDIAAVALTANEIKNLYKKWKKEFKQ